MTTVWLHTHLPRLRAGETDCVSAKVPGQRVAYVSWAVVVDAEFRVHERGRQRCLEFGVRNVHAWVVGTEVGRGTGHPSWTPSSAAWRRAVYCPWKGGSFVDSETLHPVSRARLAMVHGKTVWYQV